MVDGFAAVQPPHWLCLPCLKWLRIRRILSDFGAKVLPVGLGRPESLMQLDWAKVVPGSFAAQLLAPLKNGLILSQKIACLQQICFLLRRYQGMPKRFQRSGLLTNPILDLPAPVFVQLNMENW